MLEILKFTKHHIQSIMSLPIMIGRELIYAGVTMKNVKSGPNENESTIIREQVEKKINEAICLIPSGSPLAKQINTYGRCVIPQIVDEIIKSNDSNI